jgi:hypothetical protein
MFFYNKCLININICGLTHLNFLSIRDNINLYGGDKEHFELTMIPAQEYPSNTIITTEIESHLNLLQHFNRDSQFITIIRRVAVQANEFNSIFILYILYLFSQNGKFENVLT